MKQTTAQPAAPKKAQAPVAGVGRLLLNLFGVFAMSIPALFIIGLFAGVTMVFGGFVIPLSAAIAMLGLVLIASTARRLRAERSSRLLSYLRIATTLNLPLPEFLDALHQGEGAKLAKQAGKISSSLRIGGGLGHALFHHASEIPANQTAVIWRGETAGRLRESLDHIADQARAATRDPATTRNEVVLQYTLVVLITLLAMFSVAGVFILPKYREIFLDFESEMPWITTFTLDAAVWMTPVFVLAALVALLWVSGWSLYTMFHTSEAVIGPLRRLLEPLWWRVPVLASSYRSRAWSDVCFAIEQAMHTGRPLPVAVDSARHPVQSGVINKRLRDFAEYLRAGQDTPDAARKANLPALIAGMLNTASASDRPDDVFAFLSRYYGQRTNPLEVILRAAWFPLATLAAAAFVGWFVLAVFYPLIALIEATLQHTGYA